MQKGIKSRQKAHKLITHNVLLCSMFTGRSCERSLRSRSEFGRPHRHPYRAGILGCLLAEKPSGSRSLCRLLCDQTSVTSSRAGGSGPPMRRSSPLEIQDTCSACISRSARKESQHWTRMDQRIPSIRPVPSAVACLPTGLIEGIRCECEAKVWNLLNEYRYWLAQSCIHSVWAESVQILMVTTALQYSNERHFFVTHFVLGDKSHLMNESK